MFGSRILEAAIGLIFVYLLLSLICSSISEWLESITRTRAIDLERGIRELLHDRGGRGLAHDIYNHPLVYALYRGGYDPARIDAKTGQMPRRSELPTYIPAGNFALALMDVVLRGPSVNDPGTSGADAPVLTLDAVRASVGQIGNPPVQRALLAAIDSANGDLARAQANVEAWFNSSMDRVSGWYKRRTHQLLFVLGIGCAVVLNVDSVAIAQHLYRNDAARAAIVRQAEAATQDSAFLSTGGRAAYDSLQSLDLPIGWDSASVRFGRVRTLGMWDGIASPLLGWLMTALAVAMGAPFWFDLLNKVMVIRSTVKPHEKSPEEGSEDRRPRRSQPGVVAPPEVPLLGRPAADVSISSEPPPAPQPQPRAEPDPLPQQQAEAEGAQEHRWANHENPEEGVL